MDLFFFSVARTTPLTACKLYKMCQNFKDKGIIYLDANTGGSTSHSLQGVLDLDLEGVIFHQNIHLSRNLLTSFPLGLKVVREKLYRSEAIIYRQISLEATFTLQNDLITSSHLDIGY